jgi:PKD repeat protein
VLGGVVLVGGFNAAGNGLNDTWLFTGTWHNYTTTAGPLRDAIGRDLTGGIGADPMTWDPALKGLVMADACSEVTCTLNPWSLTWILNSTGWHTLGAGPGSVSQTFLGWGSMAYDANAQTLVFFGGYDFRAGFSENYTYTYAGPSTGWVNVSAQDSGCSPACTPGPRDGAGLTSWDHEVFMAGGYDSTTGTLYNDSWVFDRGRWIPTTLLGASLTPASFVPVWEPALAPNSSDVSPFLVGGDTFSGAFSNEWVWEYRPAPTVNVVPAAAEANSTVTITGSYTLGAGSGPRTDSFVFYGDGSSTYTLAPDQNASTPYEVILDHVYTNPGMYSVSMVEYDFFLLDGQSPTVPVRIGVGLSVTSSATPSLIDPGQAVVFSATVTSGATPYSFTWVFGDGTPPDHLPNVTHVYTTSGSFPAQLTVTDAGGGSVTMVRNISVNAPLQAVAMATPGSATPGQTIEFAASAQGGSGTYTYAWVFGDGSAPSTTRNATHSYGATGTYTATLWVNDSFGSSATNAVVVTVTASSPPPLFGSSPFGSTGTEIILLAVIVAAAGLTILYFWTRRKRPSADAPESASIPPPPMAPGSGPPPGAT